MRKIIFGLVFFFPMFLLGINDFVFLSIPKCGTHLLQSVLKELSGLEPIFDEEIEALIKAKKNKQFVSSHNLIKSQVDVNYLIDKKFKIIFLYRDPRDQLISFIFWVADKKPPHPIYSDLDSEIEAYINNNFHENWFVPFTQQLKGIPAEQILQIRYVDLVGARGGGTDEIQYATVCKIANFIDIPIFSQKIDSIFDKIWGHSKTFRKGIMRDWEKYFKSEHIKIYKEKYGEALKNLNYETGDNW